MDPVEQQEVVARILEHLDRNGTDRADGERYLDVSDYTDPERFLAERDEVCARLPVMVGHVSQLRTPGDFLTDVVHGVPILLTRSSDGRIQGFRNVCRHRAAILVGEQAGNRKAFVCPYHAWQYSTSGDLTYVPDKERCFPGLSLPDRGLLPVPVDERHGFVWVDLSDRSGQLDGFMAPLRDELDAYAFGEDTLYGTEQLYAESNWKLVVEAFLEVYHFKALHPQMKSYIFAHEHALVDAYGEHLRMIAPKGEIRVFARRPRSEWVVRPHATILYFIFPHTFLFVETRHTSVLQVRPLARDRSEVRMMHVANERGLAEPDRLDVTIKALMQAMDEDVEICESMQRGMSAGLRDVVFGRNESGLQHFRGGLDRRLRG